MKEKIYINLTNGIEGIEIYNITDYSFIRIQSSHLENKRYDLMINSLSDDLLMNLAIGNNCTIIDFGANKTVSRACWQGVEFIKFILNIAA